MAYLRSPRIALALGAFIVFLLAVIGGRMSGPDIAARLEAQAPAAIAQAGGAEAVSAHFVSPGGLPSRHPILSGGEDLDEATRGKIARAVAAIPGAGGIRWEDGTMLAEAGEPIMNPLHCQEDVAVLLRARTILFEEGSARIDAVSRELLDEVAEALQPCLGAIIQITGHTDATGPEPDNIALSAQRANEVRAQLIRRGIPADGLRAIGVGSRSPVAGLEPEDAGNRRIEFGVIATQQITPTPVDTPGPR